MSSSPTLGKQAHTAMPEVHVSGGDPNSCPHASVASTLLTEPTPQMLIFNNAHECDAS